MATDVRMPKLSDNMAEGVIIRWMKAPGDQVEKGEPLAEVETDKADVELEASDSGVLREIRVPEGQSAAVGAVIAVLAADGEAAAAPAPAGGESGDGRRQLAEKKSAGSAPPAPAAEQERAAEAPQSAPARPAAPPSRPAQPQKPARTDASVRASPLAWRVAEEAGVSLASVRGSGPGGRIVKRDVEAAVRGPAPRAAEAADAKSHESDPGDQEVSEQVGEARGREQGEAKAGRGVEPVSRMRATIARRMAEAKRDIPHFYVRAEIDMTEAMHLRESIKRRDAMPGLTVTHMLVRALATALVRHPRVNASWREGGIELHDDVNIGIAVAVEDGLVVPVLHRAQTLTLREIAERAAALTEKARQGRFGGDDLSGGTFSISNVGMLDVEDLVAVINPPQAAILAVGAVKDRPIVRDGQLAVAKTLRATLSCDHRVLNGVEGGRFLVELKGILENPVTLLLE